MSLHSLLETDRRWMGRALREAEKAFDAEEIPVGAVVVRAGEIVGRGFNAVERLRDPTAHAELIAITAACDTLGTKVLEGCTLYVTLEPCPMCAGALVWAKLDRLVFGALDEKAGACGSLFNIPQDPRLNHRVDMVSGVEDARSAELLRAFFAQRRQQRDGSRRSNGLLRSPGGDAG